MLFHLPLIENMNAVRYQQVTQPQMQMQQPMIQPQMLQQQTMTQQPMMYSQPQMQQTFVQPQFQQQPIMQPQIQMQQPMVQSQTIPQLQQPQIQQPISEPVKKNEDPVESKKDITPTPQQPQNNNSLFTFGNLAKAAAVAGTIYGASELMHHGLPSLAGTFGDMGTMQPKPEPEPTPTPEPQPDPEPKQEVKTEPVTKVRRDLHIESQPQQPAIKQDTTLVYDTKHAATTPPNNPQVGLMVDGDGNMRAAFLHGGGHGDITALGRDQFGNLVVQDSHGHVHKVDHVSSLNTVRQFVEPGSAPLRRDMFANKNW